MRIIFAIRHDSNSFVLEVLTIDFAGSVAFATRTLDLKTLTKTLLISTERTKITEGKGFLPRGKDVRCRALLKFAATIRVDIDP